MDFTKTITHLGLCAGYGGIELGLKRVIPTLRSIALCEIEAFAIANLVSKMEAGLMDAAPIWTDLKTLPWESFRDRVDILTGGYPCQPFSAAGKRLGGEDPRHLWPHISRGVSILQPRVCFFENFEGHITCGLHHVLCDLGRLGYRTTWGLFSASECGAPHQRKRVFIMAHLKCAGLEGFYNWNPSTEQTKLVGANFGASCQRSAWPSRPGEQQYGWEPPRVVGNTEGLRVERWQYDNSGGNRQGGGTQQSCGSSGSATEFGQTQLPMGLHSNESSSFLGQALTLNPYGDSVIAYENISNKINAREVLFNVWKDAISQEIQWTTRGLQCLLAEKVLQSGMQLDSFTQRICYFIWCIQTGYEAQGWGLHGMWVYETCGNSSQGQKPIEQLQRELGYAMCQLSYEIALARGQDAVEAKSIMHGVRESSERAWVLSQALPEMEEVWRSTLDQAVWEKGCYIEATSIGNRTDELRLLGNGVVPSTAALAFGTLMNELCSPQF